MTSDQGEVAATLRAAVRDYLAVAARPATSGEAAREAVQVAASLEESVRVLGEPEGETTRVDYRPLPFSYAYLHSAALSVLYAAEQDYRKIAARREEEGNSAKRDLLLRECQETIRLLGFAQHRLETDSYRRTSK